MPIYMIGLIQVGEVRDFIHEVSIIVLNVYRFLKSPHFENLDHCS